MSAAAAQPGFVNAHTHLYSGLAPFGLPQPPSPPPDFPAILRTLWWRLDRALDEGTLRASARYYVAHALLSGTTGLVDHHESPAFIEGSLDVLADACDALGMRALLCYGASERNGGREEARRGLAECRRFLRARQRALVRGAVGLHASFTVSDETLAEAGALCRELGAIIHIHMAEDRVDVDDARARGYAGPLERLEDAGALVPGSILAHGVHLDEVQVRRASSAGAWLVHNPRSNDNNRVGWARALAASARVALGTDGFPSVAGEELAALEAGAAREGQAGQGLEARAGRGRELLAESFGQGALEGDVITKEGARVVGVDVGGRPVVREGRLLTGDLAAIDADAREAATRLFQRMRELPPS
ncbi:MAG: amidohydrolase family protein [Polyangiaceae bacterium]|nr:amidohydrolase family protein [Polyangiaceae bacterium]